MLHWMLREHHRSHFCTSHIRVMDDLVPNSSSCTPFSVPITYLVSHTYCKSVLSPCMSGGSPWGPDLAYSYSRISLCSINLGEGRYRSFRRRFWQKIDEIKVIMNKTTPIHVFSLLLFLKESTAFQLFSRRLSLTCP